MATALVLSAGGMFAAWEIGVWKALCGRFQPDLIVGASAGAWNGWAIAGGAGPDDLLAEWMDPRTASIMRLGLHRCGILNPCVLYERSRELFARYRPRVPFGLTLAAIPECQPRLVRDTEIEWEHLAATCSIPLCFPPMRIEGKLYLDGGLLGALPVWAAEEMGADCAVAVNALTTWPFRMLRRIIRPRRPSPRLRVLSIEPSRPLGSLLDASVWSRDNVRRWADLGFQDAEAAIGRENLLTSALT